MKLTVQPITSPAPGQLLLPLLLTDVQPETAAKLQALAATIQMAAADGRFSWSEDLMIGLALGALFSK